LKTLFTRRLFILLWIGAIALFFANYIYPVSSGITRLAAIVLFFIVWFGFLGSSLNRVGGEGGNG